LPTCKKSWEIFNEYIFRFGGSVFRRIQRALAEFRAASRHQEKTPYRPNCTRFGTRDLDRYDFRLTREPRSIAKMPDAKGDARLLMLISNAAIATLAE
jgi:hypothetical protein